MRSSHGRLSGHDVSVFLWEPKVAAIYRVNVEVLAGWTSQRSSDADLNRGSRALVTAAALRGPCFNQRYQKCRSGSISMGLVATGWWAMKPGGGERRETLLMLFSQLVWIQGKAISYSRGVFFIMKDDTLASPPPCHYRNRFTQLINEATSYLLTAVGGK